MNRIGIVTDSHSSISQNEAKRLGIKVLPMPFYIGGKCYYEDLDITREEFFQKLDSGLDVTTSQPTPEKVKELWDEALEEFDQILYLPISSGLSGACMTAAAMAAQKPYEDKVFVVDNARVSALLHCSILDALALIQEGYSAIEIKQILEESRDKMSIYIGVDNLDYLKRGGRVRATTAFVGNMLSIKPVLELSVGTLGLFQKCRGIQKMKRTMIDAMKNDLNTRFLDWYENGDIYLLAAASASKEVAEEWVKEIEEAFPGMKVLYDDLSLGVCCHVGPNGLGIGCSCKPRRHLTDD